MKAELTDKLVADMAAGDEVWDTAVPGLFARRGTERCSYHVLYYGPEGRRRRPVIGKAGVMTVAQARQEARSWLLAAIGGRDPLDERDARRAKKPTVADLWERLRTSTYWKAEGWHAEARRLYERHLLAPLSIMHVDKVGYRELADIHGAMSATPFQANRVLSVAQVIFDEAERLAWRPQGSNPASLVRRYPEPRRTRAADEAELKRILPVLHEYMDDPRWGRHALLILAALYSGARPSEVQRMPLPPIAVETPFWHYDIAGKTGVVRVMIPAWLAHEIAAYNVRHPDTEPPQGPLHVGYEWFWKRVLQEAEVEHLWFRDFRRTFASLAYLDNERSKVADTQNHKSEQTNKVYSLLDNRQRAEVVGAVAERLTKLL